MEHPIPGAANGQGPEIALRLMATTDVHMHILPFEDASPSPSRVTGLARTASLIRIARAEVRNALLFDNGDFLHGHPLGDAVFEHVQQGRRELRGAHPIIAAMRAVGVDAITLGNHDFDHGVEFLGQMLARAPFPVVASNVSLIPQDPAHGPRPTPSTEPFTILERDLVDDAGARHRLRIGLLGFLPPGSITGLRRGQFRAEVRDIVETARIMTPQLRALGADIVVALAHTGIRAKGMPPGRENVLVDLAREVPGIDAIVGGHAHQVFPAPSPDWPEGVDAEVGCIHGVPCVIPGFWGSHLGVIDLTLRAGRTGGWAVTAAQVEVRPISKADPVTGALRPVVAPDPRIRSLLARLHSKVAERDDIQIGDTRQRLHSYFAAVAPSPALDVVHRAKAWWAQRALAGSPLAALPVLSSAAPFKVGGLAGPHYFTDIGPGPIARRDLNDLYLHPNTLCGLRLSGADLVEWLERAASVYNRITPGDEAKPLVSSATPLYDCETVAGVTYEIDLSQPARYAANGALVDPDARRIVHLSRNGTPVDSSDEFLLLTNSFRISGGGRYPFPGPDRLVLDTEVPLREITADYLAACGAYDEPPRADWRFALVPGATACFLSAPAPDDLVPPGRAIVPGPLREDGFRLYRLALEGRVSYIAP